MADTPTPTPREMEILKVLWALGPTTARAISRQLGQEEDLAHSTIQTLLRIMEKKKLVEHHVEGRTFIFTARYTRDDSMAGFLDRVFDGAASVLVSSLVRTEGLSTAELDRMQAIIDEARRKNRKK